MNYLGFNKEKASQTVQSLNRLLANYHVYYQNLRTFHWKISGRDFFDLHNKFEDLYNDARLKIDEIAERILTLRFEPMSFYSGYLKAADIEEAKDWDDSVDMVKIILENHSSLIQNIRTALQRAADAGDEGTVDLLGGFLSSLEKKSWMLDAWSTKVKEPVTLY
ncbi:MAG: DNA starvation/stationary phase protection protein [Bacteroidota bacterium]